MAYTGGNSQVVSRALGRIVGLLLLLFVFDQILTSIIPTVNASTYFGSAVDVAVSLLGPIGILGAFWVIWDALKQMQLV